jgi:hypothetical protein
MTDIVAKAKDQVENYTCEGSNKNHELIAGLLAEIERLRAVVKDIADMRYDNTSAATIARRALEGK